MPQVEAFDDAVSFYSTLGHEAIHATTPVTGSPGTLAARPGATKGMPAKSSSRSWEAPTFAPASAESQPVCPTYLRGFAQHSLEDSAEPQEAFKRQRLSKIGSRVEPGHRIFVLLTIRGCKDHHWNQLAGAVSAHPFQYFDAGAPRQIEVKDEQVRAGLSAGGDLIKEDLSSLSVAYDQELTGKFMFLNGFEYEFYVGLVIFNQHNLSKQLSARFLSVLVPRREA
jgi:hypothetical protein